jgi:hypothetical protein
MPFKTDFTLDNKTYRHYLNGHPVVMHSHHYLALITKLAEDLEDVNGSQILADTVEDTMRVIFDDYFQKNAIETVREKGLVCTGYFSAFGLGKMVISGDAHSGEVRLNRSHIDEGWLMKWGEHHKPINHFTRGYIAAVFGALFDRPPRSYTVTETGGMVTGEDQSVFVVTPT